MFSDKREQSFYHHAVASILVHSYRRCESRRIWSRALPPLRIRIESPPNVTITREVIVLHGKSQLHSLIEHNFFGITFDAGSQKQSRQAGGLLLWDRECELRCELIELFGRSVRPRRTFEAIKLVDLLRGTSHRHHPNRGSLGNRSWRRH